MGRGGNFDIGQLANQAGRYPGNHAGAGKDTHTHTQTHRYTGRMRNSRKITILDIPRHTSSDTQTTICGLVLGVFFFCCCCWSLQHQVMCAYVSVYMRMRMVLSTQGLQGDRKSQKRGKSQGNLGAVGKSRRSRCLTLSLALGTHAVNPCASTDAPNTQMPLHRGAVSSQK